jgi:membrane protein
MPHSLWQAAGLRFVRTVLILVRDLAFGQLTLRAMSLVYTTLLSIVPLLALSFSVLKAFGVHNQIQPLLVNLLTPLGEQGTVVARQIGEFIERMNVGVLGALGLALLLYTSISLMQKIEESLNYIWHVSQHRPLGERFSRYLSVLLVGPILVFAALGVTGALLKSDALSQLLSVDALDQTAKLIGEITPYLLVIAAFTFIYLLLPNARVKPGAAFVGGAVGGIVWQTAGWVFATFVASSGQYAAIYSSFAILVLFMIWLYVSWLIVLFGASVAFYVQHPEYLYLDAGEPRLSNRVRERLALSAMYLTTARFLSGQPAPSLEDFTHHMGVPMHVLTVVLEALQEVGLVVTSGDEPVCYLPARDPSAITVTEVMGAIRRAGEARFFQPATLPTIASVQKALDQMQSAVDMAAGSISLRELVTQNDASSDSGAPAIPRQTPSAGPSETVI